MSGLARRAALAAAVENRPNEFTLKRLFLETSLYEREDVRDKFKRDFESHSDSLDAGYLYARSLVGSETPAALRIYADILTRDPGYPWIHLSQLEIFRSEAFRDRSKLQLSYLELRRVCPSLSERYNYLNELDDSDLVDGEAKHLREFLTSASDPHVLLLYRVLWAAEFRVRGSDERDGERRVIAEDLKRLRQFEFVPEILPVMADGARLAGDNAVSKEVAAGRAPEIRTLYREWERTHPRPKAEDAAGSKQSYASAQLDAAATWIKVAPEDPLGYAERFRALVSLGAPTEDLGRAGDSLIAADLRRAFVPHSFLVTVARAYVERGVLLERVRPILSEALASFDDPESVVETDLAPDAERAASSRMINVAYHTDAVVILSEVYEKTGRLSEARDLLCSLHEYLASRNPAKDGEASPTREIDVQYRNAQFTYWTRLAELDEHDGRKLDALGAYREGRASAGIKTAAAVSSERRLWKDLGGSDEGWTVWMSTGANPTIQETPSEPLQFTKVNRPLPEFLLEDVSGNTWALTEFKNKTTIAVLWATWCMPCRAELAALKDLKVKLEPRSDVQMLSLNTDANIGTLDRFVKENGYTFPVLLARHFVEDLMSYFLIPRTWIIRNGVLTNELLGFNGDKERWMNAVVALVK